MAELDLLVAHLHIELADPLLRVSIDGSELEPFQGRIILRLDPGEHSVVFSKEGHRSLVRVLRARAGTTEALRGAIGEPLPVVAPPAKAEAETLEPPPTYTASDQEDAVRRAVGLTVAAFGAAGLAAGAAFGAVAVVTNDEAADHCLDDTRCDREGVELGQAASAYGTASTVGFVAGGAVLATGLIVYLTALESSSPLPAARRGSLAWAW